jgi:hypothetical protein
MNFASDMTQHSSNLAALEMDFQGDRILQSDLSASQTTQ